MVKIWQKFSVEDPLIQFNPRHCEEEVKMTLTKLCFTTNRKCEQNYDEWWIPAPPVDWRKFCIIDESI